MHFVRGLIDRLLLLSAVITGGLAPGFISQYVQRLGGRLDQARLDLAPWQQVADQYFHGDLAQLIQYHLASRDPTFHAEGAAIQTLILAVQHLQAAVDALHGTLFHQLGYLALHTDLGLARATFSDWVPTIALSAEGILFALGFGLAVWLIFHALWKLVAVTGRRRTASRDTHSRSTGS
jgi:hypothetical protein